MRSGRGDRARARYGSPPRRGARSNPARCQRADSHFGRTRPRGSGTTAPAQGLALVIGEHGEIAAVHRGQRQHLAIDVVVAETARGDQHLAVVIDGDRIVDLVCGPREVGPGEIRLDLTGHIIVPGFIDVHVHGVLGVDVMDDATPVRRVARQLPRFAVTAFCPTSVACSPGTLAGFLAAVAEARMTREPSAARVLPAHLESAYINPDYRGAQPLEWLKMSSEAISGEIASELIFGPDVGILTMPPEIPGGLDLLREARRAGLRVSLGHSGATYEQAIEAIELGQASPGLLRVACRAEASSPLTPTWG